MTESNKRAFERWRAYRREQAPMLIIKTPEKFQNDEPYSVVPKSDQNFLMGGFETIHDAEGFCIETNLPYTLGENIE